jgi:hypothetical protein
VGTVPQLAAPGPAESVMLVMDQSGRVPRLDPVARRSFAARRFIARELSLGPARSLSLAGFAGNGTQATTAAAMPVQPLWLPLGTNPAFTADRAMLDGATAILEPLAGGSAPVFAALEAALATTDAQAPPGNRAVVALLGGGDDGDISDAERREALATLRRQRDDAGIQSVVIAGALYEEQRERLALAELAAALRAPAVHLGVYQDSRDFYAQSWAAGSFAALDLAADLIDGVPLPGLSATFRVKASTPHAFPSGTTLYGVAYVESEICPMGCWEVPLEFAVQIP